MKSNKFPVYILPTVLLPILLLCLSINSNSQVNTWQSKQSFGGTGRSGAVAFSIGSKGYIGTGYDNNPTKDFWEYDPSTDTWAQKADFGGGERNHAAGFSIGNKGYLGTGLRYCMCENTKEFWEYDPATNVWTRKADFAGPSRHAAIGLSIGNKGYIGTGTATNYAPLYNDFWEYDPTTDSWTQKADFSGGARYYASAFSIGKKGYIGTGTDFTGGGFTFRKDFWEYDQHTDIWTRKADLGGTAREGAVGFNINNKGYIGTGYGAPNDFWEYDPITDSWTQKADFAGGGRYSSVGLSIGSTGYMGLGVANGRVNDFWAYTPSLPPPTTQWAKHPEGHLAPYTYPAISSDGDGNTYVTGGFDGTLTFPTSPSPTVLTSAGESDIFIAKYDATGNVVWAKRAGAAHNEVANTIKYDGFGNIYIAGNYSTNTNFDGTILSNSASSLNNVFIAKYNASTGSLLWVRQGTTTSYSIDQTALAIAVDNGGNAYITGGFSNITFDPLPKMYAVGSSEYNGGWTDIFIVKYNSDGVPQWQTSAGTGEPSHYYNFEQGNGIAVDASGNVFVTGCFNGSSDSPTRFGTIDLVSNGGGGFYEGNFFLAKYNQSTSSWEWAVQGGSTTFDNSDYGKNVSLDAQGNIYVSGDFEGTGIFGSTTLTSTGTKDYFLAKYSTNGNPLWVRSTQGGGNISTSKVDANGNFYFAGVFDGTVTIGNQTLAANGYQNSYISEWNSNGDFQWVKHIPSNYVSSIGSIEIENNGNIDITSVFAFTETFDCTTFESGTYADLAIAKLGYSSSSVAPAIQATANNICSGNSTTLSIANGNLNNATEWKWYSGNCGGTFIGSGSSVTVSPTQTTTYYARSEGECSGPGNCGSITIDVNNTSPVINSITAPIAPVAVNNSINLNVMYTGSNVTTARIKWDEVSAEQVIANPASSFTVPHTYTTPGVYSITVLLMDACNHITSTVYQYVVIYDPNGGFVTGGGWINSPAGAYRPDATLSGKAIFGFESKYQKGTIIPSGNTEFKFQAGNMIFKSSNYEWLVVSGSKAQFKGTGSINGSGYYGFMLSAVEGNVGTQTTPDLFRIKIWDKNNNDAIVYDNQYGATDNSSLTTQIAGGSIIIHNTKSGEASSNRYAGSPQEAYSGSLEVAVFPNPGISYFTITSKTGSDQPLTVRITDILGRAIETMNKVPANNNFSFGNKYRPGVYFVEVSQGDQKQFFKVVKVSH